MPHHDNATELNYNKTFPFDVIRYREVDNYTDQQIRHIVDTVWNSLPFLTHSKKSSRKKYRAVVKNYVLNLIKSYQSNYCIRISRRTNDYHYDKRYSQIHTTSTVVIKTMDSLDDNEWIDLYVGFFDRQRNKGKQTRVYPSQKFIDLVENAIHTNGSRTNKKIRFIKEDAKEIIQLRKIVNPKKKSKKWKKNQKKKYKLVPYKDTPKTMRMRSRLKLYNSFMRSLKALTTLPLTRKELTEMNPDHADSFNNMMLNGTIVFSDRRMRKGSKVKRPVTPLGHEESSSSGNNPTTDQSIHQEYFCYETNTYKQYTTHNTNSNTKHTNTGEKEDRKNEIPITDKVTQINKQYQRHSLNNSLPDDPNENAYYSIDEVLNDYPRSRKFWFRIVPTDMFRAFSDSSKGFNHHGRFYGDPVQNFPKWMRTKINMHHEEVVECDYTSIHPTMLYVMVGAVPPENIYMVDKGTDPHLRKEYKTVLLVSINHKNPKTMWSAVSSHFREEFRYKAGDERLTRKYIMEIYDRLLEHNKPIAKHMNTGVAMRLMRKDSKIADKIIMEFVSCEIPIRCIHDSFIVPAEYEAELKVLMVEYFQEVMGTDYVIEITTEASPGRAAEAPVLQSEPERIAVLIDTDNTGKSDDYDDNMKYFEGLFDDDPDNFIIIPEGHRFAGIRI